jgi:DNA polymerase-3 subunit beta
MFVYIKQIIYNTTKLKIMKFYVTATSFTQAINSISKATNKSSSNPLLECIYIKAEEHSLVLRASNLEIIAEKNISIKGEMNGSALLKASVFTKLINTFSKSAENLTIEKDGNVLRVSCGDDIFELDILNEDSFPKLPSGLDGSENNKFLEVSKTVFIDSIRAVSFAASTSEIKPEIASVYIYTKENFLFTVATDSYRLAEKKIYIEGLVEDFSLIIPIKNIGTILSILEDVSDDVLTFSPYSDGVIVSLKDINIAIRTINGTFPDYKQLFPKSYIFKVNLNKSEIINALQLTTFIALNYAFCNIKSEKEKSLLKITSKENSVGSIKKSLKVDFEQEDSSENWDDFEVNYNSNYFLDGLQKINNEKIKINFTTVARPVFISSPDDTSFVYLLMPLNR